MLHSLRSQHPPAALLGLILLCFAVWGASGGPRAQAQFQPRSAVPLSAGGGGPAFVHEHNTFFFNPANLVLRDDDRRLRVGLGSLSVYSGGDLFQFRYYNDTFTTGRRLAEAEKRRVLNGWFGPRGAAVQRSANAHADFIPLSVSHQTANRAVGVALRARLFARVSASRGWLDLLLFGTSAAETPLPLHASWQALSALDVTVAYSRRLTPRLALGVAPKLVLGTDYVQARFRSSLTASDDALLHRFGYTLRATGRSVNDVLEARIASGDRLEKFDLFTRNPYTESPLLTEGEFLNPYGVINGAGLGLDVGATYLLAPNWLLAASLTDVGFIRWGGNAQRIEPMNDELRFEGITIDAARIRREFDGDVGRYAQAVLEELADEAYTEIRRTRRPFYSGLPTAFHFGAVWRVPNWPARLNAGTSVAFNDVAGNVTRAPAVYAGGEYRFGGRYALPIRGGVRVGGLSALNLGAGVGLVTPFGALDVGLSATPYSDWWGRGGRYTAGFSLTVFVL